MNPTKKNIFQISLIACIGILCFPVTVFFAVYAYLSSASYPLDKKRKYDAIIVLGNPANSDGTPGVIMKSRVDVALELMREGVAPVILMTGGKSRNSFSEADVMCTYAMSKGTQKDDIIIENNSVLTVDNALCCKTIADKQGWTNVVIVTSAFHEKRAAYIFNKFDYKFAMIGVPTPPKIPLLRRITLVIWDKFLTAKYIVFGDEKFPDKTK